MMIGWKRFETFGKKTINHRCRKMKKVKWEFMLGERNAGIRQE